MQVPGYVRRRARTAPCRKKAAPDTGVVTLQRGSRTQHGMAGGVAWALLGRKCTFLNLLWSKQFCSASESQIQSMYDQSEVYSMNVISKHAVCGTLTPANLPYWEAMALTAQQLLRSKSPDQSDIML